MSLPDVWGIGNNMWKMDGLAVEEFFQEEAGEALGMVADDTVFFEEIV